jgi:hypothetical protein
MVDGGDRSRGNSTAADQVVREMNMVGGGDGEVVRLLNFCRIVQLLRGRRRDFWVHSKKRGTR